MQCASILRSLCLFYAELFAFGDLRGSPSHCGHSSCSLSRRIIKHQWRLLVWVNGTTGSAWLTTLLCSFTVKTRQQESAIWKKMGVNNLYCFLYWGRIIVGSKEERGGWTVAFPVGWWSSCLHTHLGLLFGLSRFVTPLSCKAALIVLNNSLCDSFNYLTRGFIWISTLILILHNIAISMLYM